MSTDYLRIVEREIINKDKDFYEDLIAFRGDIVSDAEHTAWLDWAGDLISERYAMSMFEAVGLARTVEDYYKSKEVII